MDRRAVEVLHFEVAEPLRTLFSAAAEPTYDGGWSLVTPAVQASVALYHFVEKYGTAHGCSYNKLRGGCPDLELVHDVATLAKHGKSRTRHARVRAMNDLQAVLEITQYEDDLGPYRNCRNRLLVKVDGEERDYLDVLARSFASANECLHQKTGTALREPTPPDHPAFVDREQAIEDIELQVISGFEFNAAIRLLAYDRDSGRAIPVDLSGSSLNFRIFGPPSD